MSFSDSLKEIEYPSLALQIHQLTPIRQTLVHIENIEKRYEYIDSIEEIDEKIESLDTLYSCYSKLSRKKRYLTRVLFIIFQQHLFTKKGFDEEKFMQILEQMAPVDEFYYDIGGIVGYQLTLLELLNQKVVDTEQKSEQYVKPHGISLISDSVDVQKYVRWGIESMELMGEIYPVGGAGDRLSLKDDKTSEPLPAAKLAFMGKSLIEGLFRDLEARENLYYKLFKKQIEIPVALMVSHEKNNAEHIQKLLQENHYFGRSPDSIILFTQPLVPVVGVSGRFSTKEPYTLNLKPGGHGVIWRLAQQKGVFDFFKKKGVKKALVRQINNPIAGIDLGLLAFHGIGQHENKDFGFASCFRRVNTAEGINILKKTSEGLSLTNLEYTEFEKKGIKDEPSVEGGIYSAYPANTNILFADIEVLESLSKQQPIPGAIVNMKNAAPMAKEDGSLEYEKGGRLETTMQNIADFLVYENEKNMGVFLTYNERKKTISTTKKSFSYDDSGLETPESAFFDLQDNHFDLFNNQCLIQLPKLLSFEEHLKKEMPYFISYHPALGPLYSIIAQKIQGGQIFPGSEMQLDIAEVEMKNIELNGSLLVEAKESSKVIKESGISQFDDRRVGRCSLINISIINEGPNHLKLQNLWKNHIDRKESLSIIIHGNGEFVAKDVQFKGDYLIEVPEDHRVEAFMKNGEVHFHKEKISKQSWVWNYRLEEQDEIILNREGN